MSCVVTELRHTIVDQLQGGAYASAPRHKWSIIGIVKSSNRAVRGCPNQYTNKDRQAPLGSSLRTQ